MKKLLLPLIPLLLLTACDDNSLCKAKADCEVFCRAYDLNTIMFDCQDNACKCISKDALACTGTAEDKCDTICATYQPETKGVCAEGYCECQARECSANTDCDAKCPDAAMTACNDGICSCIQASELSCEGSGISSACAAICDIYRPNSTAICQNNTCECQSNDCKSDADCEVSCQAIGAVMSVCQNDKCQCLSRETLACTGDDAAARCSKICDKFKPGALAICTDGLCTCQEL
ncbi:MAG: hypothetical protein IJ165_12955 [Proteobacteria bacterium]|nr:hypothetical protein [Pseudomonadota bacterium]